MPSTDPSSPCTRSCTLDPETDICLGCHRTLAEIVNWSNYSAEQKSAVLAKLPERQREHAIKLEKLRTPRRNE